MGYALPASIGASIVKNNSRIICIDGDGSIQINLQELHTIDKLNLPIKIFILNNDGYGIIKQFQELYLSKRYEASGKEFQIQILKKSLKPLILVTIVKIIVVKQIQKSIDSKRPEIIEIILK